MQLGIDPKNDYAFKRVFGSEDHTRVLIHLLNAVLCPPPERRVASVEILNPYSEREVFDEKLSILDVKARDQSGRQFNVEMQMVSHLSDRARFLYYWAKMYGSQLFAGEDYKLLEPAISICFVDGLLFPESDECHLHFRLWDPRVQLALNDHLAIHVFQLPKFTKSGQELTDPLDLWLFFLNNGKRLDPENLPERLQVPEVEEAVDTLRRLTQDDYDRERYEAREKARKDANSWRGAVERGEAALAEAEAKAAEAEAKGLTKGRTEGLIGQVRLCEQVLKRIPLNDEQLKLLSVEELSRFVEELRGQLPR